jgi:hypothetical protein
MKDARLKWNHLLFPMPMGSASILLGISNLSSTLLVAHHRVLSLVPGILFLCFWLLGAVATYSIEGGDKVGIVVLLTQIPTGALLGSPIFISAFHHL